MTYHLICNKGNKTGTTTYPSGAFAFTPDFSGVRIPQSLHRFVTTIVYLFVLFLFDNVLSGRH